MALALSLEVASSKEASEEMADSEVTQECLAAGIKATVVGVAIVVEVAIVVTLGVEVITTSIISVE